MPVRKTKRPIKEVKKSSRNRRGPTSKNAWKGFERDVARFFGSERTPLSGGASRHTTSDSLHPELYIEAKYRNNNPWCALYKDVEKMAEAEKKLPIVAMKRKGDEGWLIVVRPEHVKKLAKLIP